MSAVPLYETHSDFYRAEYGAHILRASSFKSIDMLDLAQTPGDFSDAETGDLLIIRTLSRCMVHAELGAGRSSHWTARGAFLVSPPKYANSIVVDHHHRLDVACLRWNALLEQDLEGVLPKDGNFGNVHTRLINDAAMNALFEQLWARQDTEADGLEVQSVLASITQRLAGWARSPNARAAKPLEKLTPRTLAICKERLNQPSTEAATLAELAALCRLSPHHFCRAFKAATGLPPHRYQIVMRMERARAMLLSSPFSIAEVGAAVGYDDPAYFSRLFTRETGVSPSRWRREGTA